MRYYQKTLKKLFIWSKKKKKRICDLKFKYSLI